MIKSNAYQSIARSNIARNPECSLCIKPLIWSSGLLFVVVAILLFGPVGCAPPNSFPEDAIIIDGIERSFVVFDPENLGSTPAPVVFVLHGGFGSATTVSNVQFENQWRKLARLNQILVVYPEGRPDSTGDGHHWNDCRTNADIRDPEIVSNASDVSFLQTLIDWLDERYPIDRSRIYFTGVSNGGLMSLRAAIEMGDQIAAVAPMAASMLADSECPSPSIPVPILFMVGTMDEFIPLEGGCIGSSCGIGEVLPFEDVLALWILLNGTETTPLMESLPDLVPEDGSTVDIFTYPGIASTAEVVFYRVNGGGHNVPDSTPFSPDLVESLGVRNRDIVGATELWKFFAKHTRTTVPGNNLPVAVDDGPQSVPIGSEGVFARVLENDTDPDDDGLFIVAVTQPAHGIVSIWGARAELVYTPDESFAGMDTFEYYVADGRGGVSIATVEMFVE